MSGKQNEDPFKDFVSGETLDGEPVKNAVVVGEGVGDAADVSGGRAAEDDNDSEEADESNVVGQPGVVDAGAGKGTPAGADAGKAGETPEEKAAREAAPKKKPTAAERRAKIQRDIDADTRRLRGVRRDIEAEETRLAGLRAPKEGLTPANEPVKAVDKDRPKPSDFTYGELDSDYIAAVVAYETKKALAADRAEQDKVRKDEADAATKREYQTKAEASAEAGRAEFDDFDDVVLKSPVIIEELTQTVHDLMLESEVGHKIAYHLASNPKEARALYAKSDRDQSREFGRLEARFSAPEAAKPKPEVKAPKIQAPVQQPRGAGGQFAPSPDTSDFEEFEALANSKKG